MKYFILVSLMTISSISFARECVVNDKEEIDWKTQCDLAGVTFLKKVCQANKVPGTELGTIGFEHETRFLKRERIVTTKSECDVTIHQCKEMAENLLRDFIHKDKCGQVADLKKVKFTYKVLNELTLEFKTIHKGKVK